MIRLAAIFLSLLWAATAQAERPVLVFAAASLKTAMDEIVDTYGDHDVRVSYAGSSALARQIQFGAPADVFVSANPAWMDALERDGLLRADTRIALLSNRLVLIAAPDVDTTLTLEPGFDLAGALGDGRLAMALVDAVPAGIYARAALETLGVWSSVASRVAQADNVRAALFLVSSGEAPLGIVYATDAASDARVRIVARFPADSHPPITYTAARLADSAAIGTDAFLGFLGGPQAWQIFERHGFMRPASDP